MDLESNIKKHQALETELKNTIKSIKLDIEKLETNCDQLKNKAQRTQTRINTDNIDFREKKDEIDNEINRCNKTNKQAFNDLLDTKNEINEMLNKKRETERKIEDENKKFREIENELVRKIADLNKQIAERTNEKQNLEADQNDHISLGKLTNKVREMSIIKGELKSNVEQSSNNVEKTQREIATYLDKLRDVLTDISKIRCKMEKVNDEIKMYSDDHVKEM